MPSKPPVKVSSSPPMVDDIEILGELVEHDGERHGEHQKRQPVRSQYDPAGNDDRRSQRPQCRGEQRPSAALRPAVAGHKRRRIGAGPEERRVAQ